VPRPPGARVVTLGVGGDVLGPVDLDLTADGPGLLVAGPPGTGRSSTLLVIADGLAAAAPRPPLVLVLPRASPLRRLVERPGVLLADPGGLAALLGQHPGATVVVDDAELVLDGSDGAALDAAVERGSREGTGAVVGAGSTDLLLGAYRGWTAALRRTRSGLLLAPAGPAEGELLGVRLPRPLDPTPPPGRALLVRRGRVQPVQLCRPDEPAPQTDRGCAVRAEG